jgi:SWI/SNF-related matrix-associated actin-dependent regulator of chromatin subfamily A member 5
LNFEVPISDHFIVSSIQFKRNPQADLQAQDRAHRIGQKKPVQVYRLVTDETVEVKVVERAQQKLKLDAMVVQQGRLQDKDKKMSKNDLLETLRFGADKIFRNKDSTISDADIDMILEEGRKRTAEMNEKLQVADKGDMFDFRLDGGMEVQVFEGTDYSRGAQKNNSSANNDFFFIDIGRRDRKTVQSYAETQARQPAPEEGDKKFRLPKHLKLMKMDDWQFFDRKRLQELQALEIKMYEEMVEKGEIQPGTVSKLVVLPTELHEEKQRLLAEGFGEWSRNDFLNFHRACGKYGRNEFEKIAKDVNKSAAEVRRYSEAFWRRGKDEIPNFETVVKNIEKVSALSNLWQCICHCISLPSIG